MGVQSGTEEELAMTGPNHKQPEPAALVCFIMTVFCVKETLCLINEKLVVEPTFSEHLSPNTIKPTDHTNTVVSDCTSSDCGNNSHRCPVFCGFCEEVSPGKKVECLAYLLDNVCLNDFDSAMNESKTDPCIWGNVSGFYSDLSMCTEEISDCLCIPWPNALVEQEILKIHEKYFKDCPSEEPSDPPPVIVFALVITPICLIPAMVSLVVLKTKNGDGSP
ncbi:hypothetical protein WMY93_003906 [Mugilogobius chulae]|uniref:Receptor activity modifying protein 2 n=1 Tax=Mugilogobius chulae TaxID=88201 RepID=A0AAW0Q6A1_9GOBI